MRNSPKKTNTEDMQDEREKKSLFLRKFENMKKIHRRKVLSQSRKKKRKDSKKSGSSGCQGSSSCLKVTR